jgi:nitrile hydratase accessory protein
MTISIPPEADLDLLPALPREEAGAPVFKAPWEAQAFAMTLSLHGAGAFTWREWAAALATELAAARGEPDDGSHYYEHWLAALEKLVAAKRIVPKQEMEQRVSDWDAAARATPHGQPVELRRR